MSLFRNCNICHTEIKRIHTQPGDELPEARVNDMRNGMWLNGSIDMVVPGYGSEYDNERLEIVLCDGCIKQFVIDDNPNAFAWTDSNVFDFVNWYINLHGLGTKYELENQTIMDTFKVKYNEKISNDTND